MSTDEYKLVPTTEFNKLATELEKLKDNPFLSKTQGKDMKSSIDVLHKSIGDLLDVFKQAHKEMTEEERETRVLKKQLQPVLEQFAKVEDNQETIANGVVVVSDAVTKLTHRVNDLHRRFDDVNSKLERLERMEKILKRLDTPDVTKTTRKFYTSRQYPGQPGQSGFSSQDLSSPGLSPTPYGMTPPPTLSPISGMDSGSSFSNMPPAPDPSSGNSTAPNMEPNGLQKKSLFEK